MASRAEESVSRSLRAVLADLPDGAGIGDSEQFRQVLSGLEFFLPHQALREIYPEWDHESLDGIIPAVARKTGDGEAEIFGLCILISDQAVIPIHLRLKVAASADEVSWLECRLGERGKLGMLRLPYDSSTALAKRLHELDARQDQIEWVHRVSFGQPRRSKVATEGP